VTRSLLVIAMFVASCGSSSDRTDSKPAGPRKLPHYNSPDFTPRWGVALGDPTFHRIRPFTLVNQRGEEFTERDLHGKIVVADFFFTTCPAICPRMTESMHQLQTTFRDDDRVMLISHSVTPDSDTVEVLQEYAKAHHVDFKQWKLLTGPRDEIYDLGRKYYFVEEDLGQRKSPSDFLHTENFVLLDRHRHLRGIYNSLDPTSMQLLVEDIHVLEREQATVTVGER
jgi:protein SCO1